MHAYTILQLASCYIRLVSRSGLTYPEYAKNLPLTRKTTLLSFSVQPSAPDPNLQTPLPQRGSVYVRPDPVLYAEPNHPGVMPPPLPVDYVRRRFVFHVKHSRT